MITITIPTQNMFELCDAIYADDFNGIVQWTPNNSKVANVHCSDANEAVLIKFTYG